MATSAAVDKLTALLAFSTTDHYGNDVICTSETWNVHIVVGHPEMRGRETDVQAAISMPNEICPSTASVFAFIFGGLTTTGSEIRAVVRYDDPKSFQSGSTIGKVATSYERDETRFGQPQIGPPIFQREYAQALLAPVDEEKQEGKQ